MSESIIEGSDGVGSLLKASKYNVVKSAEVEISTQMRSAYVAGDFGSLTLKSETGEDIVYDAYEVHLTTTSLHTVNGDHYDGEVMILHRPKGSTNALAQSVIVSGFFETGTASSPLFSAFGFSPDGRISINEERDPKWNAFGDIDIETALKPALSGSSLFYNGSVPVPPCTENVKWFVLRKPLPVGSDQTSALHEMLRTWSQPLSKPGDGTAWKDNNKRPPVSRKRRKIIRNTLTTGGSHQEDSCATFSDADKARSAVCWKALVPQCGMGSQSPAALLAASDELVSPSGGVVEAGVFVYYKPSAKLSVSPTKYTLDAAPLAENDLGSLILHGRQFPIRKLRVKAVANHVIEDKRYAAELVIEHTMFGDTIRDVQMYPEYTPWAHSVMLSVPIKVGKQSALLRQLGLGVPEYKNTIRHGLSFSTNENVDVKAELEAALQGKWFWYNGSMTEPDCRESVKWLVLETPIEASLAQMNSLNLLVPGMESTRMPSEVRTGADTSIYLQHLPPHAIQIDKTCPAPSVPFSYLNTHCWDKCKLGCSDVCTSGLKQSPINIDSRSPVKVKGDNFLNKCRWKPVSDLHIVNSGHSFVVANQQMGYIEQIGDDGFLSFYNVVQLKVHMPSEHLIDGKQFHGELQVVHARQISNEELDYDDMLTTSIMLDIGDMENPLLKQLLTQKTPVSEYEGYTYYVSDYPIDLMRALGPVIDGSFYTYEGSMTTPPCKEGMKWYIFETPQTISMDQWVLFKTFYANPANNRPLQQLNGRLLAKNAFDAVDEEKTMAEFDFWGGRDYAHNRRAPGAWWIFLPAICTVFLCTGVMVSTFVMEDTQRKQQAAGGLENRGMAEMVGKSGP